MIGMNQIKKRLLYGILIGSAVGIIGIVITIIITSNTIKSYEEGINKDFIQNYTSNVVTFNREVLQGEKITSDMVTLSRVHNSTIPMNAIMSEGSVVGQIAKYNIPSNTVVVSGMIGDEILPVDVRTQQITAVMLPAKLTVGEYVDIKFQIPSGVEYVVLPQKQVLDISGTTIWMNLSDEELLMLNSVIVDSYLTEGSKLYAVEYADPATQISTDDTVTEIAREYIEKKIRTELEEITGQKFSSNTNTNTNTNEAENTNNSDITSVTVNDDGEIVTQTETQISLAKLPANQLVELVSSYAIEYRYFVESYNKIETTYQPNRAVMSAMEMNPYIVEQAKEKLSADARAAFEAAIKAFEDYYEEDEYSSIISGLEGSISTQQSIRDSVLQNENY